MKIEEYTITIPYRGQSLRIPVKITESGLLSRICALVDGTEVLYIRSHHDDLIPMCHTRDLDPELLYRIGNEIQRQRRESTCYM
ncbi:MAG TPA: hypothetical protein VGC22_01300 [Chitinophaga sp.]